MTKSMGKALREMNAVDAEDVTPLQRARMRAAALALKEGQVTIPLRCGVCKGTGLYEDPISETFSEARDDEGKLSRRAAANANRILVCVSCGKRSTYLKAHELRRQEISAFIREGIDVDLLRRREGGNRHRSTVRRTDVRSVA